MPIFLGMSLAMTLNSESRHLVFAFPFVVALTIKVLDAATYYARDRTLVSGIVAGSFPGLASYRQPTGDGILDEFRPWWNFPIMS